MNNLIEAMAEEKRYVANRMNDINTSLSERLMQYGYLTLDEYFQDKKEYLFSQWQPEVYRIDENYLATQMENAIINGQYGIYIMTTENTYAFHGNDTIDYDLCKELSVETVELGYNGGTIIGDKEDLGILLVMPIEFNMTPTLINNKILSIIQEYIDNAELVGNDILINNKKVMGSMSRIVGNSFVWAAQISFANHNELIAKICNKPAIKEPSYIDNIKLSKNELERRILEWL